LTKYLSPADFGRVVIFQLTTALTLPLINLNTHGAISRRFFDKNINFASYLSNCLFIAVLTTLLFSILFLLSISILKSFLPLSLILISSIPLICLFQFLSNLPLYVWQVEIKPFKYSILSISQSIVNVSATLLFVVFWGHGWEGRVNAVILSYIIFSFIGLIILTHKRLILFRINGDYIKNALKFGIPLLPNSFSSLINTSVDKLFITYMVGVSEVGLYSVGYLIGSGIDLIGSSFNQGYVPWLYNELSNSKKNSERKIVIFVYSYFIFILLITLGLSTFAPYVMNTFLAYEYSGSSIYVIYIAFGYAFIAMQGMVGPFLFYTEKTYLLSARTVIVAIINIVLNYTLIQAYGAFGAALSTTISFFIGFLITYYLAAKIYPMPWFNFFGPLPRPKNINN